jgi:hypothetical protein
LPAVSLRQCSPFFLEFIYERLFEALVERGRPALELDTPAATAIIALGLANSNALCANSERPIFFSHALTVDLFLSRHFQ